MTKTCNTYSDKQKRVKNNVKRIYNVEKIIACGNMVALGRGKALVGGDRETGLRE